LPRRIKALLLLAFAVLAALLRRVSGRSPRGVALFRRHYAKDGLAPLAPEQREAMRGFGVCIACGLCDRGERGRIERSGGAYHGVMELMLSASRSMPDFGAAALAFAHVPEDILADKELICPTGVKMRKIASFVRAKAADARVSQPIDMSGLPPVRPSTD
jgi:hypothetical protein